MFIPGVDLMSAPAMHPLVLLLAALVLDACFGEARGPFARMPHPVRLIGAVVGFFDRKLNRSERSSAERRVRGLLTVAAIVAGAFAVGWGITAIGRAIPFGWIFELALTTSLIAQRSLDQHVSRVAQGLATQGLDGGRAAVAHIVGRDVTKLDRHGVSRAAIESCAENFSDGVVAPVFWCALFGLPGILVYKAVNTLDSMIGYRTPKYLAFGMAAARLDDLLNLLPARLAGFFVVLGAAFVPQATPRVALQVMRRDAGKHRSPNAGWPEAAMAGALGLALAGPRHYPLVTVEDPWIGDGTADADVADIRRALMVYRCACLVNVLAVVLAFFIHLALG